MSAGILNLNGQSAVSADAAESLAERVATVLGVKRDYVVIASTPEEASLAVAKLDPGLAWTSRNSVVGLDDPLPADTVTTIQIGPEAAPVTAVISPCATVAQRVRTVCVPVAPVLVKAGLDALRPAARLKARSDRALRDQRLQSVMASFEAIEGVSRIWIDQVGLVSEADPAAADRIRRELGLEGDYEDGTLTFVVPGPEDAAELVAWLGTGTGRTATIRRTTKETDIAVSVDLDGQGGTIDTGVHFFDHMLDQIARHGGLGLSVVCEGDVEVDSHHTIEDVCLALGEGLREALGDKRGIARFGFETPMDETRASVWIDLSGRPYARFDGDIPGERVGDFPIEMCAHAFRSLAESLRAAIHVKVDGENAHHMVESCFKSFGRALRMAKAIEGDALPSTKGVL